MKEAEGLIDILKEEQGIYNEILKLANEKTDMIAQENIDSLEDISKREEKYVQEAKIIEYKREDKITEIEKSLEIEKVSDISSLLKYLKDEDLKKQLEDTQMEFTNTLSQLKSINIINNTLIQDALEYIDLSLNLMTDARAEGTYGKGAEEAENIDQNKSLFDFKG